MIAIGACSLGFVNITLPAVCHIAHPVSETHSGGTVELLGFAFGSLLTQLSSSNPSTSCAVASLVAAILMSTATSTCFGTSIQESKDEENVQPKEE